MKYIVKLEVIREESDAPKGEELDRAVENGLLDAEIEGCYVNEKTLRVERAAEVVKDTQSPEAKDFALIAYWAATEGKKEVGDSIVSNKLDKLFDKIIAICDKHI